MNRNSSENIFFITPRPIWPLRGGDSIRAEQSISYLCESFSTHKIVLITLAGVQDSDLIPNEIAKNITVACPPTSLFFRMLTGFFKLNLLSPLQVRYFFNQKIHKYINRNFTSRDFVVAHTIRSLPSIPSKCNDSIYIDFCDSLAMTYERALLAPTDSLKSFLYKLELPLIRHFEQDVISNFSNKACISAKDKEYMGDDSMHVIPNWHETVATSRKIVCHDSSHTRTGIMIGNFSTLQNLQGAKTLVEWTKKLRSEDKLELVFAGKHSSELQFSSEKNVRLHGEYEELDNIIDGIDFSFCLTLISGGLQNKVIETGSRGLLNIITPNVESSSDAFINNESCIVVREMTELEEVLQNISSDKISYIQKMSIVIFSEEFSKKGIYSKWNDFYGAVRI